MRVSSDAMAGLLRPPPPKPKQPTARARCCEPAQCAARGRRARLAALRGLGRRVLSRREIRRAHAQRTVRALLAAGEFDALAQCPGWHQRRAHAAPRRCARSARRHGAPRPGSARQRPRLPALGLTAKWCLHKRSQGFQSFTEYAIVKLAIERANLERFQTTHPSTACHLFRHACATHMPEGGTDIRFIQALLGHADLSTTEVYTQVGISKFKAVHTATHPARLQVRQGANADALDPEPSAHGRRAPARVGARAQRGGG